MIFGLGRSVIFCLHNWCVVLGFRLMVLRLGLVIGRFWFVLCRLGLVIFWLRLMICWFGLVICRFRSVIGRFMIVGFGCHIKLSRFWRLIIRFLISRLWSVIFRSMILGLNVCGFKWSFVSRFSLIIFRCHVFGSVIRGFRSMIRRFGLGSMIFWLRLNVSRLRRMIFWLVVHRFGLYIGRLGSMVFRFMICWLG